MITPHTFLVVTSNPTIQTVQLHSLKSAPVVLAESLGSFDVKFAVLVDTDTPLQDYHFIPCYTGRDIDPDVIDQYVLTPLSYNMINDGSRRLGSVICQAVAKSNKKYTIELVLNNGTVSTSTMSILLNDVILSAIGASDMVVKNHISSGDLVHTATTTTVDFQVSEEFFNQFYGSFVIAVQKIPSFASCSFKGV